MTNKRTAGRPKVAWESEVIRVPKDLIPEIKWMVQMYKTEKGVTDETKNT